MQSVGLSGLITLFPLITEAESQLEVSSNIYGTANAIATHN